MITARSTRWPLIHSLAVAALLPLACSSTLPSIPADGLIPLGVWGGDNGGLIVGDTSMHLHVGCTFGDVSGRVTVDRSGRFDVPGSYMLRAYPVSIGPTVPARFVGQLDGSMITVTAQVDDTVAHQPVTVGPVTLFLGTDPRLGPCPICRRPVRTH
jgi:hypothetical protein